MIRGIVGNDKPVVASFSKPVRIQANNYYLASINLLGAQTRTFGGKDGVKTATVALRYNERVRFHFKSYKDYFGCENPSFYEGQIPEIHFFLCPE
ncbi:unnamed protein product [Gongylonema pulchrum]|uniref:PHR domain-containing protein n=1 Tax=Gongylonema pulchrum TaxID=637853 RepID=A0A183EM18_9BILA|nr:unnamed protein product [Gongylonema pulchrum]